jgi:hypothetical protein
MKMIKPSEVLNVSQAFAAAGDDLMIAEDLLKRFLAILTTARVDLETARTLSDEEELRYRVHRLCSGGLYLGFEQVGMGARILETHLKNPASPGEIAIAWTELNDAIQAVLEVGEDRLQAWLRDEY